MHICQLESEKKNWTFSQKCRKKSKNFRNSEHFLKNAEHYDRIIIITNQPYIIVYIYTSSKLKV